MIACQMCGKPDPVLRVRLYQFDNGEQVARQVCRTCYERRGVQVQPVA